MLCLPFLPPEIVSLLTIIFSHSPMAWEVGWSCRPVDPDAAQQDGMPHLERCRLTRASLEATSRPTGKQ
ncbi:hypothetical protein JMJ77_0000250, partial [Colletotrichum scovillei]